MLIRVSGGHGGIKEYLERGHKQGREHDRDDLDERVILAGDLEFTDQLINDMQTDAERYLHITLAFKEDEVSRETLANITRDFQDFVFAAYGDNEVNFYAEAHLPKIKSYVNVKTGELVERKPHIHIVIPKINMLSGGVANPLGLVEKNERFIDAFQEHVNNKYGLASPKDHRRIEFTNASDMIQRYKDDHFDGNNKELKKEILAAVLDRKVTDYEAFTKLVTEFGETRTRNAGKESEYQNVKPEGQAKGVNLKDYVFTRAFIELPDVDKRAKLSAEVERKYEVEGQTRRDPANIEAGLADWHGHRAMEIKYLNSGNKKQYQSYQAASLEDKQRILAEQARKFYDKYQEPKNEPDGIRRNPFEHAYGFKRPQRELGRGIDGPGVERTDGRAAGAERAVDGRGADRAAGWSPGGASGEHGGRGTTGAGHIRGTEPDSLTSRRIAFAASGKHDPFPIGRGQATKTINGVRTMSGIDVAGDPSRPKVLLQDHARFQLDDGRASRADALRRDRHRQRDLSGTGRASDSSLSQLSRDLGQRQQIGAAGELAEFKEIRSKLEGGRLLAELSVSHGVIIDKYAVSTAPDGSSRIKVGNRNLNVSDFLTKEMRLPWAESAAILRQSYARQVGLHPSLAPKAAPTQTLWRKFQDERQARGGQRQLLAEQLKSEQARRLALRDTLAKAQAQARALPGAERKAALSVAKMGFMTGESALKDAIRAERQQLRTPVSEQYRVFLHGQAQGGDDKALAELRRMAKAAPVRPGQDIGSIGAGVGNAEPNSMFYRGKEMRHLVHKNGDVLYTLGGRAIIQDNGDKLLMLQTDRVAIEAALRLGEAKFGNVLALTGPKEFQERAARIAAEAGIKVTFYDKNLEAIREQRGAELASERAKKAQHRDLGSKFVGDQRRAKVEKPEAPKPGERPSPAPAPKEKGPER